MSARICQNCGSKLAEDARFCPACGKEVAVQVCGACGAQLPDGAKFCQGCGAPVAPAPPQPAAGDESLLKAATVVNEKEISNLRRKRTISTSVGLVLAAIAVILFVFFSIGGPPAVLNSLGGELKTPVTTPRTPTPTATTPTKTSAPTTTAGKTSPPTTTAGKPLNEILGLSSSITAIKYDMLVSGQGVAATTKVWAKKNRMRTEITQQGTNVVTFIDADAKTVYVYMAAQNLAMKMPFDPAQVPKNPAEDARSIANSNARILGTETIDSKACSVIEFTSPQGSVKAWIWQDRGIPIRMEVTSSAGKTMVEYKNIDFADIPDSMFVLPAGIQIISQ